MNQSYNFLRAPTVEQVIRRTVLSYTLLVVATTLLGTWAEAHLPSVAWMPALFLLSWGVTGIFAGGSRCGSSLADFPLGWASFLRHPVWPHLADRLGRSF